MKDFRESDPRHALGHQGLQSLIDPDQSTTLETVFLDVSPEKSDGLTSFGLLDFDELLQGVGDVEILEEIQVSSVEATVDAALLSWPRLPVRSVLQGRWSTHLERYEMFNVQVRVPFMDSAFSRI